MTQKLSPHWHILFILSLLVSFMFLSLTEARAEEVHYHLTIAKGPVNVTGKNINAITINGQMPGPTLTFTEGDIAVMKVTNTLPVPATIHWHGLLVPNAVDGVPYVTTLPVLPGKTEIYRFPLIQTGTYWYHSHFGLQEQYGLKGTIVIHPKELKANAPRDVVLSIGDWNDEIPSHNLRSLKRNSPYFALKKNQVQTITGAIKSNSFGNLIKRNFYNVLDADLSDVGYDTFMTNGSPHWQVTGNPGELIRLRVTNTSTSSYFYLNYAGGPLKVIAADGLDITPTNLERLLIATAESYDFLVKVPQNGQYEFRATSFDGTGYTSTWIGDLHSQQHPATDIPQPDIYQLSVDMTNAMIAMKSMPKEDSAAEKMPKMGSPSATDTGMPASKMPSMKTEVPKKNMESMNGMIKNEFTGGTIDKRPGAPYGKLRSPNKTTLNKNRPWREITLNLTGDMDRYLWTFNGKTLAEDALIAIKKGENVRFIMTNKTMMRHPLHLHGHFFRVVTEQGEYSTLKHTVDVAPMQTTVIEFAANEEKDWFFHCHNLYHMVSGMERIVHYEGTEVAPEVMAQREKAYEDPWYTWTDAGFFSQMTEGVLMTSNSRNNVALNWQYNWNDQYDVSLGYYRYFNRFFSLYAGFNTDTDMDPHRNRGVLGFYYLLPFDIDSLNWVDHRGNLRTQLSKPFQITDRLSLTTEFEYDSYAYTSWGVGLNYWLTRRVSFTVNYDSDYYGGAGISVRF
ncbi:multicopper oxidase domain-containing protein [uncultured Shewanella sp.]|uniref:multicopper oxidase domain-containing protein n=1 Tax=uncultured Shewanella sp. TaxID=173975 RepID=UPI00262D9C45|nr:multicopper oxidase domain-containing protein [uncultured Shewanella sp.]